MFCFISEYRQEVHELKHSAGSLNHGRGDNQRRHLLRLQSILIQSGERESEMVRLKEKKEEQHKRGEYFTSFKVYSADNQNFFRAHHPGTASRV